MAHQTPAEKKALVLKAGEGGEAGFAAAVTEHAARLDADYFNEFPVEDILGHIRGLSGLTRENPFVFEFSSLSSTLCGLTALGDDLPGFFAALTGLLAGRDFDIKVGKAFTYGDGGSARSTARKIVDYLVLEHPTPGFLTVGFRTALEADLLGLAGMLRAGKSSELRADLYRRVGDYLGRQSRDPENPRPPVEIKIDADPHYTVLTVRGADHKALLFSLASALSLRGISIRKFLTRDGAETGSFEDRIFITGEDGGPISDARVLDRIRTSLILMERFVSALPQASDYQEAVTAFNNFIDALAGTPGGRSGLPAYEDFATLSALAKILGAGPYLWEEMIRLPFPAVAGLLGRLDEARKHLPREQLLPLLEATLAEAPDYEGKIGALNAFKDFHLFRLDAVYLAFAGKTLEEFSGELSDLAELVLQRAMELGVERLRGEYGTPRVGVEPCPYGLFAQGKLGGRELGYASDLEVQLLYGGSGETDGAGKSASTVSNADFFARLMLEIRRNVWAKAEGIFELDLRLRPHGDSGPLASNLETWAEYYAPEGAALDYERQALIKFRPVAGIPGWLEKAAALRDVSVYRNVAVGIAQTLELREKQIRLKTGVRRDGPPAINAKYSPGALVEVEYATQFLQLRHGGVNPAVRGTNTEITLKALLEAGCLSAAEFETLFRAYVFLRRLINALRVVRGHSRDLMVPQPGSDAFLNLARRMGYLPTARYPADSQLDWDLQHTLRGVRALFARRFLGVPSTEPLSPTLADIFLSSDPNPGILADAAERLGLGDVARGAVLMRDLLAATGEKGLLGAVLVACEAKLRASPDPEAVLLHLSRYLQAVPDADRFVRRMLDHPRLSDMLVKVFGHSEYLAGILIARPDFLDDLGESGALEKAKLPAEFRSEIRESISALAEAAALEALRGYRNREYLRIGLRDIYLDEPLPQLTAEISHLSNQLLRAVFDLTLAEAGAADLRDAVCVIALGKLGGNELNYSSDIDLVFVFDAAKAGSLGRDVLESWARVFIAGLSASGNQGKMFRVDANLRPYGGQGSLVASIEHCQAYYLETAGGWELQAWLKARPAAGNLGMGCELVAKVQALAVSPANRGKIERSMRKVRMLGLEKLKRENRLATEVKLGPGGIRTIEFYAQYLQILNGAATPELVTGNTLEALGKLHRYGLLSQSHYELLSKSYIFLRRVEHVLQLQGLRQRHELPAERRELEGLARRLGFEDGPGQSAAFQFRERYRKHMLILQEFSRLLFAYEADAGDDVAVGATGELP